MKRLLLIICMCCSVLSIQAQRCAVLDFMYGGNINQEDVEGISYMFRSNFYPRGYTMIDRVRINRVIKNLGYKVSDMTLGQILKVSRELEANKIVVGNMSKFMDEYTVEARVINVETGTTMIADAVTFERTEYRSSMLALSKKICDKMNSESNENIPILLGEEETQQQQTIPYVIYGYLKIFPNDLGEFLSEPVSVISRINAQVQYGYNNWRIPTNEELSLMRANKCIGEGDYMTQESMYGIVRLVTDGDDYVTWQKKEQEKKDIEAKKKAMEEARRRELKRRNEQLKSQGLADLGLPSGTLWSLKNESETFTYDEAVGRFGSRLPSKEQFQELWDKCVWTRTDDGYNVTGPSEESIFLPFCVGFSIEGKCDGKISRRPYAYYWTSSPYIPESSRAYIFEIDYCVGGNGEFIKDYRDSKNLVRLVQK